MIIRVEARGGLIGSPVEQRQTIGGEKGWQGAGAGCEKGGTRFFG